MASTLPPRSLSLAIAHELWPDYSAVMRLYGAVGLMVYSSVAIIVANLQVQIATKYSFFHEPIALGTIVFSSIFIVSGILTKYYGLA